MKIKNILSPIFIVVLGIVMSTLLVACNKIPTECQTTWDHIEKLAKESGIPEDALKDQRKQFDKNINSLSQKDAIQSCNAQNKVFELYK